MKSILAVVITAAISSAIQTGGAPMAAVTGTVVSTAVPPVPLSRVLVTITGPALKASRTLITDDQGRFAFSDLPAGRFTVVAARTPYVKTAFGAKRPGRPGVPIDLAAGQRFDNVTIALARGAAITGLVRGPTGEPMPGVQVVPTPLDTPPDLTVVPIVTDDRGIYRIFGLSPGRYVVRATYMDRIASTAMSQRTDAELDEILAKLQRRSAQGALAPSMSVPTPPSTTPTAGKRPATYGYAPVFYPGTVDPDEAQTITLVEGDERSGMDFTLPLARNSVIEGQLSMAPSNTQVTLRRMVQGGRVVDVLTDAMSARIETSGTFRFTNVLPGRYRINARAVVAASSTPVSATTVLWATADVTVADDDLPTVSMTMQPSLKLTGKIAFDGRTQTPPSDLAKVAVRVADIGGASNSLPMGVSRADGVFEVTGILPGSYSVTSSFAENGWALRSVMVDGRDVLDFPLEFAASDITGALATFSDQHSELSGTLQLAPNVPATDYFVVVFAEDRTYWRPNARRVKFTRPSTEGKFAVRDLPAGDYLIAALTDMDASDLNDSAFIGRLVASAAKVHIGEGEKKVQDLRIGAAAGPTSRHVKTP